ncbi:MAG: YcxB family protein [Candidatus Methylacidiphilales bacterium]
MKYTATYEVTAKLQDDSMKQFYWHVLLRPRIGGIFAILAVLVGVIFFEPPYKPWVVGFMGALFLLLIVMWAKAYFQILSQARDGLRLMEHPNVEVTLDDSQIEYVSSTGSRRHHWNKIEKIVETTDFIILMNGELPLLSLPKACFTNEALNYIKEKSLTNGSGASGKSMTLRHPSEYSSHMAFAKRCLAVVALTGLGLMTWTAITFAPTGYSLAIKVAVVLFWVLLCAAIFSVRSFVIAYQCKKGLPQTFDRPCPEYIPVATILLILTTALWPV